MDPQACLQAAESAVVQAEANPTLDNIEEAQEHLSNYRQWRDRGGFEPDEGDDHCTDLRLRLLYVRTTLL